MLLYIPMFKNLMIFIYYYIFFITLDLLDGKR